MSAGADPSRAADTDSRAAGADSREAAGADTLTIETPAGPLCLLAARAAYLPEPGLLLVADAHLGKAQAFRRLGVPVPSGSTSDNLQRLNRLIAATQPRELVFLGDLLHAPQSRSPALLSAVHAWRERHASLPMTLVRGNHDQRAGDPPASWGLGIAEEPLVRGQWALCHEPDRIEGLQVLAGHVHPGCAVGRGPQRLMLPCFHLAHGCAVLPAFGEFTGLHGVKSQPGERLVLIADGQLRLLPT